MADDASPAFRLISHHATSSPPQGGATREQTTESSSATSTVGHAESAGTSLAHTVGEDGEAAEG